MGQRYIIVTANANPDNIKGIIRYDSSSAAWTDASAGDCYDEDASDLVPYLAIAASSADYIDNPVVSTICAAWSMLPES